MDTSLVVSRKAGEAIIVTGPARIEVIGFACGKVRLRITADQSVDIDREEVAQSKASGPRHKEPCAGCLTNHPYVR